MRTLAQVASPHPPERVRALFSGGAARIAGHGLTEPALARLERELVAARRHGYAVNREDTEPGVSAVGVAILLSDGRPLAGLSVAAPVTRLDTLLHPASLTRIMACRDRIAELTIHLERTE